MGKSVCGANSSICSTSRGDSVGYRHIALGVLAKVSDFKFRFLSRWTTHHIDTRYRVFYCINTNVNISFVHDNNIIEGNV